MRDYALMGVTTVARTAVALGTLLLLASTLGPGNFGFISVVITWSTIVSLITDYGFGMRALRDIGSEHALAGRIMSSSLAAKTLLVLVACATLIPVIMFFLELSYEERLVAVLFLTGILANSYGDLSLMVFRGLGQYHREARVLLFTSLFHFLLIGLAILLSNELLLIGLAFFVSRLIYATSAMVVLARFLTLGTLLKPTWQGIGDRFRSSTSFALDSGATNIFSQLDVILVNHLAGREMAGIYFAGSRLLQGAVPFSVLLASIHVPRFAHRLHNNSKDIVRYGVRIFSEYVSLGICFALAFFFIGPLFTEYFLGVEYAELDTLWLAFACFTAARFMAAGLGVQLIALGTGYLRTFGILASGIVTVICYCIFIPQKGVQAAPWVSTLGMVLLILIYGFAVLKIFNIQRHRQACLPQVDVESGLRLRSRSE